MFFTQILMTEFEHEILYWSSVKVVLKKTLPRPVASLSIAAKINETMALDMKIFNYFLVIWQIIFVQQL